MARRAFGTSTLAAFTDFLFQDDGKVHYSLATMQAIFKPAGAILFWYCPVGLPQGHGRSRQVGGGLRGDLGVDDRHTLGDNQA